MEARGRVFDARLQDYTLARGEIVAAIANQHMTLALGTAALAAAFGAGFLAWMRPISPPIFLAILPLSWWILTMWLGEVARMLRAVEFCAEREEEINAALRSEDESAPDGLRWESWRRARPQRTVTWTYKSVAFLMLTTNLAALACWTATAVRSDWTASALALTWALAVVSGLTFVCWALAKFQVWAANGVGTPQERFIRFFMRLRLPFR